MESNKRVCAVIVAGGVGERFGNPGGKQLVDVCGRPLMSWSIRAFDRAESIEHIVVVCPAERRVAYVAAAIEPFEWATSITFADAGETRQASTRSGVMAAPEGCDFVAIHDSARPLITPAAIDAAVAALAADPELAGTVCGQPAIDTLKLVDAQGVIASTPDRSKFWTVQTPQVFDRATMLAAYDAADAEGFCGTDDASLVERAGGRVLCVPTARDNLKVTVPEDLLLVTALMQARLEQERASSDAE